MSRTSEVELIVGEVYRIELRSDYESDVDLKNKLYIYKGVNEHLHSEPYHEFILKTARPRKNPIVLAAFLKTDKMLMDDYEYGSEPTETTANYSYFTTGYIDYAKRSLEALNPASVKDSDELYGYDEIYFNICEYKEKRVKNV